MLLQLDSETDSLVIVGIGFALASLAAGYPVDFAETFLCFLVLTKKGLWPALITQDLGLLGYPKGLTDLKVMGCTKLNLEWRIDQEDRDVGNE